jgi:hypothetical protein
MLHFSLVDWYVFTIIFRPFESRSHNPGGNQTFQYRIQETRFLEDRGKSHGPLQFEKIRA